MFFSLRFQKAINKASILHFGQMRKGDGNLPYISHPFSVAWILSQYTRDEDIVIAGLFHDVLEDVVSYKFEDLVRDFGDRVANIVQTVSEPRGGSQNTPIEQLWKERKLIYLENIRNGSREALLVSAADKIHNIRSLLLDYEERGEDIWQSFHSLPEDHLWFMREVANIVRTRLDTSICAELDENVEKLACLVRRSVENQL